MTFDEAIGVIQQTEQAMQTALAEERYDDAQSLGKKSVELMKTLTNMGLPAERHDEFLEFARAYSEYAHSLLETLKTERERIKREIIGLNKGTRANRSYDLVSSLGHA